MKKISFKLLKYNNYYEILIRNFYIWHKVTYTQGSIGGDIYLPESATTEEEAIEIIYEKYNIKPSKIILIQYPTIKIITK